MPPAPHHLVESLLGEPCVLRRLSSDRLTVLIPKIAFDQTIVVPKHRRHPPIRMRPLLV